MHRTETPLATAPYGLAFTIEDLLLVRAWVAHRGLALGVTLDWVVDDAEFEELLVVAKPGADRRTLTLWRTVEGFFAQTPSGTPRCFPSVAALLDDIRPVRARRGTWLQRLGL